MSQELQVKESDSFILQRSEVWIFWRCSKCRPYMTTPQKNTNNGSPENAPESLKGSKRLHVYNL